MPLKMEGVLPPHVTPFKKDEEVDEAALRRLVHFWLDAGCSGLVSCGSNGEAPYMTRDERKRVVEIVVDETDGEVPVIAGTGAPSTRETITLTRDAKEAGADAALVVPPYYFQPSSRELVEHYRTVVESADIPIVLYNVPKFTGYNVDPGVFVQLAEEYSQIIAIKESSGLIGQISWLISRVRRGVSVLAGTGDLILPSLSMGGRGAIVAVANVAPRACVEIYRSFRGGYLRKAGKLQMMVLNLNEVVVKKFNQISSIKEALRQLGQPAGYPRRPSLPLDREAREEIGVALSRFQLPRR